MKKFNVGDTVARIKDGEIIEGVVTRVVDLVNPPILVVDFDGEVEKVHSATVILVQKSETKDEVKNETEAKAERPTVIRCPITRYIDALMKVTSPEVIFADENEDKTLSYFKGITSLSLGMLIGNNLFGEKKEIELDKYMLLWEIVNQLTPSELSKNVDEGCPCDFYTLSGAMTEVFLKFINELFGAENE